MIILIWLLSIESVVHLVYLIAHTSLRVVIKLIDGHFRALHLVHILNFSLREYRLVQVTLFQDLLIFMLKLLT